MLTESFRRRLEMGTNTRWARDLEENHLVAVLWALGEYGLHEQVSKRITRQLDQHESEIDPANKNYARARVLLEVMWGLVRPWYDDHPPKSPAVAEARRMIAGILDVSRSDQGTGRQVFSPEVSSWMNLGNYCHWASAITEDRLFAVLAVVGEFGSLADVIADQLNRHQAEVDLCIPYARARTDLDVITQFVRGSRFTLDEVCGRVKLARRKAEKWMFKPSNDWWSSGG